MDDRWKPNVTVAAVIEREGRFLMVEEETQNGLRLNQPAGHLDHGESLLAAVVREAREETAHVFVPQFLVGIYQWRLMPQDVTYLRFTFAGTAAEVIAGQVLDTGIVRALWMTEAELRESAPRHRSPLVLRSLDDWLAGKRFPLDVLWHAA
ncbi:MAG: NUDIX hydrolase [Pseudazoarcus pumilus]|nr:NUDIX hydrolase [Pseudazoarcus pumilus]